MSSLLDFSDDGKISIYEGKLTIDPDGNAGIGTTSPKAKLEVIGTIKAHDFVGKDGLSIIKWLDRGGQGDIYYDGGNVGKPGKESTYAETGHSRRIRRKCAQRDGVEWHV